MDSKKITPKMNFEDSLTSFAKTTKTIFTKTSSKLQETWDFDPKKPKELFTFITPLELEGFWSIELTNLKLFIWFLNIQNEKNRYKISILDEILPAKVRETGTFARAKKRFLKIKYLNSKKNMKKIVK